MQIVVLPAKHVPAASVGEKCGIPLRMHGIGTVEVRKHQHVIAAQDRKEVSVAALDQPLPDDAGE